MQGLQCVIFTGTEAVEQDTDHADSAEGMNLWASFDGEEHKQEARQADLMHVFWCVFQHAANLPYVLCVIPPGPK